MTATLDDLAVLERLIVSLKPEQQAKLVSLPGIKERLGRWKPNPGPQTIAYHSDADELFYGGQAGGGKTDLIVGLSLTAHNRSLVLRRTNKEATGLVDRYVEILGSRTGWNGQEHVWRIDGRIIDISGCQHEDDKQKFKGVPHDLIAFDEVSDFLESQFRFIIGWNRSADKAQRCRVVAAGNPPTTPEGLWVLKYWAPWLDPAHPDPAPVWFTLNVGGETRELARGAYSDVRGYGGRYYIRGDHCEKFDPSNPLHLEAEQGGRLQSAEYHTALRWFTTIAGEDTEVDGPGPHLIGGEHVTARSRTFIPAELEDNPDLAETNYASVLAALPEELRAAYKEGRFDAALRDDQFQVIPTRWIIEAQNRWKPDGYQAFAMTAMAFDPAGGGNDAEELIWRHGGWFSQPITAKGAFTADGSRAAGIIVQHRRHNAPVIVDVGGGYGGAVVQRLGDNAISHHAFNGANASIGRTRDGKLSFVNKRAEAWWRMREELNPDQEGGSVIALPPSAEVRADLAAPRWQLKTNGIQVESKEDIRKRLGRSPGKGDVIVMCLSEGQALLSRELSRSQHRPPKVLHEPPKKGKR